MFVGIVTNIHGNSSLALYFSAIRIISSYWTGFWCTSRKPCQFYKFPACGPQEDVGNHADTQHLTDNPHTEVNFHGYLFANYQQTRYYVKRQFKCARCFSFPPHWLVNRFMTTGKQHHGLLYNCILIEAETKRPPFRRWQFQMHFLLLKCLNFNRNLPINTKCPTDNTQALFKITTWRRTVDMSLSGPMKAQFDEAYMHSSATVS